MLSNFGEEPTASELIGLLKTRGFDPTVEIVDLEDTEDDDEMWLNAFHSGADMVGWDAASDLDGWDG